MILAMKPDCLNFKYIIFKVLHINNQRILCVPDSDLVIRDECTVVYVKGKPQLFLPCLSQRLHCGACFDKILIGN